MNFVENKKRKLAAIMIVYASYELFSGQLCLSSSNLKYFFWKHDIRVISARNIKVDNYGYENKCYAS